MTIAKTTDVQEGRGTLVELEGLRLALFCVDGEYYAIDDRCTHAEGSLAEGDIDGHMVECPLHGARFDLKTGQAMAAPASEPVRTYPLHVEGDEIQLVIE
jgi:3-phenylpropionate/trans-cinnamate dioxygenase ferredoxin subunit